MSRQVRAHESAVPEGLSEAKRALLERLRGGVAGKREIEPSPRNPPPPLSFAQQRLWFLDQLTPGTSQYNTRLPLYVKGGLNVAALHGAINDLVARHEILRTSFPVREGHPVQHIESVAAVDLPVLNVSDEPPGRRKAAAISILEEEAARPFVLDRGPLLRCLLVRLGETEHILLMVLHHSIADGWSLEVAVRELGVLYEARVAGAASPLPALPIQYADFAVWQRRRIESEALDREREYWTRRLRDLPRLRLPVRRSQESDPTARADGIDLCLAASLRNQLEELAARHNATLFMALLAAYMIVLRRLSNQDDIVVGSPIANRDRFETEGLIGFFANTLVLRTDLSGDPTFLELLGRVRSASVDAFDHQELPFESVVESVKPERQFGVNPLFQVMFALQSANLSTEAAGLVLEPLRLPPRTVRFDLETTVWSDPDGMRVGFVFNSAKLEKTLVCSLTESYRLVLEAVARDPGTRLSRIEALPGGARHFPRNGRGEVADDSRRTTAASPGARTGIHGGEASGRERELAAIWQELLGVERVEAEDNFFDLGGHSLLAAQLIAYIHDRLDVRLPLAAVFKGPTLGELARELDTVASDSGSATVRADAVAAGSADPLGDRAGGTRNGADTDGDQFEFPASFSQERLLLLNELQGPSGVDNIPVLLGLSGPLRPDALESALAEIVRRHAPLRTTLALVAGRAVQKIRSDAVFSLRKVDLTGRDNASAAARRLALAEMMRPFDLGRDLMLRATLFQTGETDFQLALTMHHAASDGWSLAIFFRELKALYAAYLKAGRSPLPELEFQYGDFSVWQREWLEGGEMETQLAYWREQLACLPEADTLPTDHPRPAKPTVRGASVEKILDGDLARGILDFGSACRATPYMVFVAALSELLHRRSGSTDIPIGLPIAGRSRVEVERLIGFFLNTLVLRTDTSGEPSFLELVRRVRRASVEAYSHQDVPFERVLSELDVRRDLTRTPLFQVFVNMPSESEGLQLSGIEVESIPISTGLSRFDLTLYIFKKDGDFRLRFTYNSDLFDRETIQSLAGQLKALLATGLSMPDAPLSSLPLEAARSPARLPDPSRPLENRWQGAVHDLVARNAAAGPARTAVVGGNTCWSYAELHDRTDRLAGYLSAHGIRKGDVVAVFATRSPELVESVIGILKAGGIYTILDPGHPTPKTLACLTVVRPRAWIDLTGAAPGEVGRAVRHLDENLRLAAGDPRVADSQDLPPELTVLPEDGACLTFTSGSSGQPKAVLGRHGPLTHFTPWMSRRFGMSDGDRFVMLSSLAHDPLQRDIFTPLSLGASLHIPEQSTLENPSLLRRWMAEHRISACHLTPSLARLLTEGDDPQLSPDSQLRLAFYVGEALSGRDTAALRRWAPGVRCVNLYGTTETQRAVGYYEIPPEDADDTSINAFPLGSGMPGVQLLVLRGNRLADLGEVGEICVRSPHLAEGYLGDRELTAERFVSNPLVGRAAEWDRVYRTGDLGAFRTDGTVLFRGRADGQIKIHGFRVEPGEIESALREHELVRECGVTMLDEDPEASLAAFVVPEANSDLRPEALRDFLRTRLAAHLVPGRWSFCSQLPRLSGGKIDREALARLSASRLAPETPFREPQTPTERALAEIWSALLEPDDAIGLDDNYFDLGGTSLLAVDLFTRAERRFGLQLPLALLFKAPTIAQLGQAIDDALGTEKPEPKPWTHLVEIRGGGDRPPLFLFHSHGGNVLEYRRLVEQLDPDQPVYAFQSRGLDGQPLRAAKIEEMAAAYVDSLRRIQPRGPYFLGGFCFGGLLALEAAHQLRRTGEKIGLLALLETWSPWAQPRRSGSKLGRMARLLAARISLETHSLMSHRLAQVPGHLLSRGRRAQEVVIARVRLKLEERFGLRSPARPSYVYILEKLGRIHTRAIFDYTPDPYPGSAVLFRASRQPVGLDLPPALGWEGYVDRLFVIEIPGYRQTVLQEPNVGVTASRLSKCLRSAQGVRRETQQAAVG